MRPAERLRESLQRLDHRVLGNRIPTPEAFWRAGWFVAVALTLLFIAMETVLKILPGSEERPGLLVFAKPIATLLLLVIVGMRWRQKRRR
jgi:hypothetical protein